MALIGTIPTKQQSASLSLTRQQIQLILDQNRVYTYFNSFLSKQFGIGKDNDIIKYYSYYKVIKDEDGSSPLFGHDGVISGGDNYYYQQDEITTGQTVYKTFCQYWGQQSQPDSIAGDEYYYNINYKKFKRLLLPSNVNWFFNQIDDYDGFTIFSFDRQDINDRISKVGFKIKNYSQDLLQIGDDVLRFKVGVSGELIHDGTVYGYILYDKGLIILKGDCDLKGFQMNCELRLSAQICFLRILNSKYNYSTNPTFIDLSTGKFQQYIDVDNPKTYVTGIGLYSDAGQLLAIAKLSQPIQKSFVDELNFRVKIQF